jgi:lipopolysaccharide transport system ATP-binding protein
MDTDSPTVFHITHYKAGSRWVHRILRSCVKDRIVVVHDELREFLEEPIQPGGVYSAVYVTREQFDSVSTPPDSRRFVVIRDLRDTLVSGYFSLKLSHANFEVDDVTSFRGRLQTLGFEQGLMQTLEEWLPVNAQIQQSWLDAGEPLIRYEDLLDRDHQILERTLLEECELDVPRGRLRRAIENQSFERLSGGRERGQEDTGSHYRKGVAGDWRNYFTEPVKDAFKERWGELLVATGYERDLSW